MWENEKVFSVGDLNSDNYKKYIRKEYEGNYAERLEHVKTMIYRLSHEYEKLDKKVNQNKAKPLNGD